MENEIDRTVMVTSRRLPRNATTGASRFCRWNSARGWMERAMSRSESIMRRSGEIARADTDPATMASSRAEGQP